jgi:Ca2+-transporting ATPase
VATTLSAKSAPTLWRGLTDSEAQLRLREFGPNTLPAAHKATLLSIAFATLKEPMLVLLLSTGVVYVLIGDSREAVAILASIFLVIGISVVQKQRTERTLEALRDLTSPRALVVRAEGTRRIPSREVVPEDIVVLTEGDRVPADGQVVESVLLALDESLLTGESLPVQKDAVIDQDSSRKGGDATSRVYSGSLVVRGHGVAIVTATGARTEIGKIGRELGRLKSESSNLEKETAKLVRAFGLVSMFVCVLVAVAYGLLRGDWSKGVLSALALAISMVPEEFPVVLTIFMALGAWRISRKKVLTRRFPAIEMLGSATVICVDKTGTLTENRMTVREVFASPSEPETSNREKVLWVAALSSDQNTLDPVDKAVQAAANLWETPGRLIREYPLSSDCMLIAKAYTESAHSTLLAAKGAPEEILKLTPMPAAARKEVASELQRMTDVGMRVIAVATGRVSQTEGLPEDKRQLRLELVGLIGMADPIRPSVPDAIAELARAGVRVVMITGDYPGTARAIAAQAGLPNPNDVMTGETLDRLDELGLRSAVRDCNVFARVRPDQKLRLVEAFKSNGEVVAMTGDGVNDAPALKAAHIGIAMGARGSDVAREAAALVLADDDFPAIVSAVRLGRRIYDNLAKAVRFVFAAHVPIAGMAVLPVIFNWPILLMPLHIVFIELIIDPACSMAFEAGPEEPDIMQREPRAKDARLFDRSTVIIGLLQGIGLFFAVLVTFLFSMRSGHTSDDARAIAFTTLVVGSMVLIWANLSATKTVLETKESRNPALWLVTLGATATLLLVLYVPYLRILFQFSLLHLNDLALAFALGSVSITWFEVLKLIRRRKGDQMPLPPSRDHLPNLRSKR